MAKNPRVPFNARTKIRAEMLARAELDFEMRKLELSYAEMHDRLQELKDVSIMRDYGLSVHFYHVIKFNEPSKAVSAQLRRNVKACLEEKNVLRIARQELETQYEELKAERWSYNVDEIAKRYCVSPTLVVACSNARIGWENERTE
jgi:hypothetical protein